MITRTVCKSSYIPEENPVFIQGNNSYKWFETIGDEQIQWDVQSQLNNIKEVKDMFYEEQIERERQLRDTLKPEFRKDFIFSDRKY